VAPVIEEVIGTAKQLAEKNQNRLIIDVQENLGPLISDPMRLTQILLNLLRNLSRDGGSSRQIANGHCCARASRLSPPSKARNGPRIIASR
jgi:nitrogen-specific signal transduction histidine kinase